VREPLLQAFPFPSTLGEVTLHLLSQACVFIYSSHGKWVFPPLLWSFPPTATVTSFPTPGCWACAAAPAFSSQLERDFPSPCFGAQGALPSLLRVFFVIISYYSGFFPLFSLGGGQSVQGAMLIWPSVVCGRTACRLAHLVHIFPSRLGTAIWQWCRSPLVSPFNVKWRCSAQAGGVEESKFCLFSVVFPVRRISSVSPRFYFRRHAFCFLPLATILESLGHPFQ
jgi:hypothetical protein